MKFILVFLCSLAVLGCKNTDCSKLKPFTDVAASTMATTLQCSGKDAMSDDFLLFAKDKGMCKASFTGTIASLVCPILVPYVMSYGIGKLPAAWKCAGSASEAVLKEACLAIPL